MNLSLSTQSLKDLFTFPFRDTKWQEKFLIGSALIFANWIIPLVPYLPVLGYGARLIRAGARNEDPSKLPAWDDWGDLLIDGLRQFGASLILTLPGWVLMMAGWLFYMVPFIGMVLNSRGRYAGGAPESGAGMLFGMLAMFVCGGIGLLIMLVGGLLFPPAAGHVATQRRFGAFFEFGQWWKVLRANLGGFILILFITAAIYFVTVLAMQLLYMTLIFCFAIPFVMAPLQLYMLIIFNRLIGQAYGEGLEKLNPSTPAGQPASDLKMLDQPPAPDLSSPDSM